MELADLVNQVSSFEALQPREKIKLFAWFLHTHRKREVFDNAAIRACFADLHLADPNVAKYLSRMVDYKDLMKVNAGFKLERAARVELDKQYGVHQSIIQVSRILSELPDKIPNVDERTFLTEALKCYKIEAYRACVVMIWNLAYSHILHWILKEPTRLAAFNAAITRRFQKITNLQITKYDDFLDGLKESQVIEIANTANLFNSNIYKILKEKLDKRNIAAHPSSVVVVQSQADDVVTDLVNNVVLALT